MHLFSLLACRERQLLPFRSPATLLWFYQKGERSQEMGVRYCSWDKLSGLCHISWEAHHPLAGLWDQDCLAAFFPPSIGFLEKDSLPYIVSGSCSILNAKHSVSAKTIWSVLKQKIVVKAKCLPSMMGGPGFASQHWKIVEMSIRV